MIPLPFGAEPRFGDFEVLDAVPFLIAADFVCEPDLADLEDVEALAPDDAAFDPPEDLEERAGLPLVEAGLVAPEDLVLDVADLEELEADDLLDGVPFDDFDDDDFADDDPAFELADFKDPDFDDPDFDAPDFDEPDDLEDPVFDVEDFFVVGIIISSVLERVIRSIFES